MLSLRAALGILGALGPSCSTLFVPMVKPLSFSIGLPSFVSIKVKYVAMTICSNGGVLLGLDHEMSERLWDLLP